MSETAVEIQNKFAFYLVALVFTLLAASVQTADFGVSLFADATELIGWLLLLISGLTGLRRIEMMPKIYSLGSLENQANGPSEAHEVLVKSIDKKQKSALRWYFCHKIFFVTGLVSILVARGSLALTDWL